MITSLAAQRVEAGLVPWQVSHDFVELGQQWIETRKIRLFLTGPCLKGVFREHGSAAYYPDGLDGTPPPPGAKGCDERYDSFWNSDLDQTWSRISADEFEERYADQAILDRLSPLTELEDVREG